MIMTHLDFHMTLHMDWSKKTSKYFCLSFNSITLYHNFIITVRAAMLGSGMIIWDISIILQLCLEELILLSMLIQ